MANKEWSKFWKSSKQPRKQRKYVYRAPLNKRHKMLAARLSKELREQYSQRNVPVRTGDTVEIKRGQFRGLKAKVNEVSLAKTRVFVDGAVSRRPDGTEKPYPIHPSNLEITKLDLSDSAREEKIKKVAEKNQNGNK